MKLIREHTSACKKEKAKFTTDHLICRILSRKQQVFFFLLHLLALKTAVVTYSTEHIGFESCHLSLNLCVYHDLSLVSL